jgi:hypothetical protein
MLNLQDEYSRGEIEFPVSALPGPWNSTFQYSQILQSVSAIEKLIQSSNSEDQFIYLSLPIDLIVQLTPAMKKVINSNRNFQITGAKLVSNGNKLPDIIASIRCSIIDFCFAVANDFGQEINLSNFNLAQKINHDKIYHIMETTIHNHGNGNIINTGNSSSIHATINITKGSIDDLHESLRSLGIDEHDIMEIIEIVQSELPNQEKKRLGNKAIDWISKITGKALKGMGSIASNISSDILSNIITQYYGL